MRKFLTLLAITAMFSTISLAEVNQESEGLLRPFLCPSCTKPSVVEPTQHLEDTFELLKVSEDTKVENRENEYAGSLWGGGWFDVKTNEIAMSREQWKDLIRPYKPSVIGDVISPKTFPEVKLS